MSVATYQPVLSGKPEVVKIMDDTNRKRANITTDPDDNGPPIKKQATLTNGASSNDGADMPKFGMANSSWQVDLEVSTLEWTRTRRGVKLTLIAHADCSKGRHYSTTQRVEAREAAT